MKSKFVSPKIGVIDALATGLAHAARRPWLVAIPALVDLGLWLAPRLSVKELLQHLGLVVEGLLRAGYSTVQVAGLDEMLVMFHESIQQLSTSVNLANAIGGHWLALPSALMPVQANRFTVFTDGILAPLGIGVKLTPVAAAPLQWAPIEIKSAWLAVAIVVGFWLVGHLLAALYLRVAAKDWLGPVAGTEVAPARAARWQGLRGLFALTLRLIFVSLLIGVGVSLLFTPLLMATSIASLVGGAFAELAFALTGGITLWLLLWFLTSAFFTSEGVLLDGVPVLGALLQSAALVRSNGVLTLGLVVVVNLLMLGFRAAWGLLGQTPVTVLAAIIGNAYLATGVLLAVFAYYDGLRKHWIMVNAARSTPTGQS